MRAILAFVLGLFLGAAYATSASVRLQKSGPRTLKRYRRYTKHEDDHAMQLIDYDDNTYLGQISLGTPPQEFRVLFSTFTSDFWVVDVSCTEPQCSGFPESGYTKQQYDRTKSSTYQADGREFKIGSGATSGEIVVDRLELAGFTFDNQSFGAATRVSGAFGYEPFDGYVGLVPTNAEDGIASPIQNLLDQFDQKLFVVWLDRHLQPSVGVPGGLLTFGKLDADNCDHDIVYTSTKNCWQFTVEAFSFDKYTNMVPAQAISDTATAFLGVPSDILRSVISTLHAFFDPTYQLYTVACDASVPNMLFTIGGSELFVEGNEYILDVSPLEKLTRV